MDAIIKLDNLQSAENYKSVYFKSDKALGDYLREKKKRRDKDVTEIYLGYEDLTDLRSLEQFRNLKALWLQSNKLKKLSFIQNNHALSEIYLQNNLIQSIENCFRNLTNVSVLFLHANQISDLESVANELSYLKYLKNLNLFDNPIALEKMYHKLIVYRVPSLEIFDRNTLKINERKKTLSIYEPEKNYIDSKHSFMRCFNPESKKKSNAFNTPKRNFTKSLSTLNSNFANNSFDNESINMLSKYLNDENSSKKNLKHRRSVKEFSYFDWSKVKLNSNDYLKNERDGFNIFNKPLTTSTSDTSKIDKIKNKQLNDNYFKLNELPQVITIRFA